MCFLFLHPDRPQSELFAMKERGGGGKQIPTRISLPFYETKVSSGERLF